MSSQATSPQSSPRLTDASASTASPKASAYLPVAPLTTALVNDLKRSLKLNLIDLFRSETGFVTLRPCWLLLMRPSLREDRFGVGTDGVTDSPAAVSTRRTSIVPVLLARPSACGSR